MNNPNPRLLLTVGEPAGIGPDITIDIAEHDLAGQITALVDPQLLDQRAQQLGSALRCVAGDNGQLQFGKMRVDDRHRLSVPVVPGKLDQRNAAYVHACIRSAAKACLGGEAMAMVTAPVHKGIINEAGISFSGHTELIAKVCEVERPVMMLANQQLRVALVTTHLALRDVPAAITCDAISEVVTIVDADLRNKFGLMQPRILLCGLNPHAGEDGHMGTEEIDTIIPCVAQLQAQGLDVRGPLPADTAFTPRSLAQADAVIAMYHDQGLPVIKAQGFGHIVNITLGLPIIRTSVDHGTALDLAASGRAESSSLLAAIAEASRMAGLKYGT